MAHIRIDFDGLTQQASSMGSLISSYEGLNGRMKSLAELVKDGWEGEASSAYAEMMEKYLQQAAEMRNILEAFKGYATQAAQDFDEADRSCANLIRNAF